MALHDDLKAIAGAQELYEWFGYWPSFHDAEIVSLHLNRTSPSVLTIHTWQMTNEVDKAGYYVLAKHVVVEFILDLSEDDDSMRLFSFNHQNVIESLGIDKIGARYSLTLGQCYGLAGTIKADNISIRLTAGKPGDRQETRT